MSTRHARPIIWLHWVTLIAVLSTVALALLREVIESHALRTDLLTVHRQLGLVILIGTVTRFLVRWRNPPKAHPSVTVTHRFAAMTHSLMYGLLLALPVIGVLATQAHGTTVTLFGAPILPTLIERNRDFSEQLVTWHSWGAWTLLAAIGLHAAAALWHHYVRRDDTLLQMLPPRRRGSTPMLTPDV
ncbi:cytochrome b [Sinimarinibacterium sp. CAU 1509]|uniref:cytochrome b n=1 Tax=Sinimarinibacterium sp. CAU 1509 TaxID=2562283 RepID=UPI0010AD8F59|nr:cytochrome b/b6 domain-containing protein [Sinimarinibacterium sp. CAU 1509]TJY61989.1 cytochrome b [Sinimarinibacterium sp. CAU 1509]